LICMLVRPSFKICNYTIKMNNHKILVFSSSFFIAPFLYLYFFVENPNLYETVLSIMLIGNLFFSVLFWNNPVKFSLLHTLDKYFVRLSVIAGIIYISLIKDIEYYYKYIFYIFFFIFTGLAKLSTIESDKVWCSDMHIVYHFLLHIFGISGSYIAFI
jgi:hypothetical protein